jgi:FMN-dependent NADH-azoreductase
MNILQVNSSARTEGAHSTTLANALVERFRADNPGAAVTARVAQVTFRYTATGPEGLAMGPEALQNALASAHAQIDELVAA